MRNLILLVLLSSNAFSASFDCAKASTEIEKNICNTRELSDLDYNLGEFYNALKSYQASRYAIELKQSQMDWLAKRDSLCSPPNNIQSCLKDLYQERLISLTENYVQSTHLAFYDFACNMDGNQSDLTACARKKYDLSIDFYTKKLTQVQKAIKSNEYAPKKEVIDKNSELWKQYIEGHCSILESWGGSIATMQRFLCLTQKYKARTLEISEYKCNPSVECAF